MKIAWARLSLYVELDPYTSMGGYTEIRFMMLRELIRRGHEVTIFTPIPMKSEVLMHKIKSGTFKQPSDGLDYEWIKKLKYEPKGFPDKSYQVLYVENGTASWMYHDRYWDGAQIRRCVEVIDAFRGLVIFDHVDPDLPFPLYKMSGMPKYDFDHSKNPYRKGRNGLKGITDLEDYSWGTNKELFENKKLLLWVHTSDIQRAIDMHAGGGRCRYKQLVDEKLLKVASFPSCCYNYGLNTEFNHNPEFDVMYTGYPRGREKMFEENFSDMPDNLKMAVTGPWERRGRKDKTTLNSNVTNLGYLAGFINMTHMVHNRSKSVLCLCVSRTKTLNWVTYRHLEVVFSKSIGFYDKRYSSMDKYLGPEFALGDKADVMKKYLWVKQMTSEERYKVWKYQYDMCKRYNMSYAVSVFERQCADNGVDVEPTKIKQIETSGIDLSDLVAKFKLIRLNEIKISQRSVVAEFKRTRKSIRFLIKVTGEINQMKTYPKANPNKKVKVFKVYPKIARAVAEHIRPETGTRFKQGSSRQLAFEIIYENVRMGRNALEVKESLDLTRKENGYQYDLDKSYFNFICVTHPEYFRVYEDGHVEIVSERKADVEAILKVERIKNLEGMRRFTEKVKHMRTGKPFKEHQLAN